MKSRTMLVSLFLTASVACASTASAPATTAPGITISSPTSGATVTAGADADKSLPITFAVSNFTLAAPGKCAGAANCGHIHILVDGAACTPPSAPYNNAATSGTSAIAKLAACSKVAGSHTAALELHNDDHSPVKDASGATVQAQVQFTAQ